MAQRISALSAIVLALVFFACRDEPSVNSPSEGGVFGASIEFTVSGGFVGGVHTQMTVASTGAVTLHTVTPQITGSLTSAEQAGLAGLATGFWSQPDTLRGGCMDDFTFDIRWSDIRGTKTVIVDGCSLMPSRPVQYPVLVGLVQLLDSIAARVYREGKPWRGMTADFSIDDSSYAIDRPIQISCLMTNPTSGVRTLSFDHTEQLWFAVTKDNTPGFHFSYPPGGAAPGTTPPSVITLEAGEHDTVMYLWDHTVTDSKGNRSALSAGTYHLQMGLLAGDFGARSFAFDVYDRSIPVKGDIVPDYQGASSTSATYTFQLRITNWTTTPVSLQFPGSQRIAVEAWDLNFDPPTTMIYSTPILPASNPETVTLTAGESVVFSETVAKNAMQPWYLWVLAKIRVLSTNVTFSSEGQVQISHS